MKQRLFRAVLAVVAATAFTFLSACVLFRDTMDSVFDEGENTIAKDRAASEIETAEFNYEFGGGRGTATIRFKEPYHVRIDLLDGDRCMVFCLNGASGWMFLRGDVIDMTAEDIQQMHAALLQALPFQVNFQDIFANAELQEGTESVCGEDCNVIHAVFRRDQDVPVRLWFGVDTDLLRQFEVTREDGVHTMQYFGYRTFDGVTLPTQMFKFSPDGATKVTLTSFEANIDIPAYVFRKPEMLSALEGGK